MQFYYKMKNFIYTVIITLISNLSFAQVISEKQINNLAREMSESLTNTKVMNSEILINRVYSSKRDIVTVYDVPKDMQLSESSLKKERIEQLKAYGGDFFYKNKINLEMWFMKDKKMYKHIRINYNELKQ